MLRSAFASAVLLAGFSSAPAADRSASTAPPSPAAAPAAGHDHDHDHDRTPSAVVRLTRIAVENLGLETAEVELRPMEKTFSALGSVDPEPGKVVAVASRVSGRVTRLAVHDGQAVKAGELLLEIESRVAADPPPRLAFRSPIDGLVLETSVLPGGPVEPDRTLVTVVDLAEVDVVARVFEARLGEVRPDQVVHIYPLAFPDRVFTGRVKTTAANVDRDSATLRVFVHTENPDRKLLPGMRARLAFVVDRTEPAVVVPRAAVLGENGDFFVFRQVMTAPFAYERTPVVVGLRDDRHVEIVEGVLPGDRVVVRGNYPLQFAGEAAPKIEDDHGHSHGPGGHQH